MKRKRLYLSLLITVLAVGGIVGFFIQKKQRRLPVLFRDLPAAQVPSSFPEQTIAKRWRWVQMEDTGLAQLSINPKQPKRVRLNLFPDLEVTALITDNKTHWNKDQSAMGFINDDPDSMFVMSRHEEILMGLVVLPDARQVLISHVKDGKYVIVEVDPSKGGGCGNCMEMMETEQPAGPAPRKSASAPGGDAKAFARRLAMNDSAGDAAGGAGGPVGHALIKTCTHALQPAPPVMVQPGGNKVQTLPANSPLPRPRASTTLRTRPVVAAMNLQPLLAGAGGSYTLQGQGGSTGQTMGPTTPHSMTYQRPGYVEYIDILFLYDRGLLTQEGSVGNIQAKITLILDALNGIYAACAIQLEVRQAGALTPASRRQLVNTAVNLAASGYAGPGWEEVQAPVRPNKTNADPLQWTVWAPVGAQLQAKVGVYKPKFEDASDLPASATGMSDYLGWLLNRKTSLLYGDQNWASATFNPFSAGVNTQQPYVNLPAGYLWRLEPNAITLTPPLIYDNTDNPNLLTGPVDHAESPWAIQSEPATPGISHDTYVFRYDQDGLNNVYGTTFGPNYSGVLGLRMDVNGSNYNNVAFTGNPQGGGGARYTALHGQMGDFNPLFSINSNTNRFDARADIVCMMVEDGLTPGGVAGLAQLYSNSKPTASPANGVGRGPYPQPNLVHEQQFTRHDGDISLAAGTPYLGTFNTLRATQIINSGPSGLVGYWPFSGNADDLSGLGNNGAFANGAAASANDRFGNASAALHLDGIDDQVTIPITTSVNIASKFTVCAWVRPEQFTHKLSPHIFAAVQGAAARITLTGDGTVANNGTAVFYPNADTASQVRTPVPGMALNQWHFVSAVYDGSQHKIFRNGALVAMDNTVAGGLVGAFDTLLIGSSTAGTPAQNQWQGQIDDVRLYNRALGEDEVMSIFIAERRPQALSPGTGLVLHYPFDNGSLLDQSVLANDANATPTVALGPTRTIDRHGANNSSYTFDGADDGIRTASATNFPVANNDFTVSLWVSPGAMQGADGAADIVVVNRGQPNRVYQNMAGGQFVLKAGVLPATVADGSSVVAGDINKDGFQDIIVGNGQTGVNGSTVLYLSNGDGTFKAGVTLPGGAQRTMALALADLDGDSFLDLVQGNYGQANRFYINDQAGGFKTPANVDAAGYNTRALATREVNGSFVYSPSMAFPVENIAALPKLPLGESYVALADATIGGLDATGPGVDCDERLLLAQAVSPPVNPAAAVNAPPINPIAPGGNATVVQFPPELQAIPAVQQYPVMMMGRREVTPTLHGRQATYDGINFPGNRLQAEASARRFLESMADTLGVRAGVKDLGLVKVQHGQAGSSVFFKPKLHGRPIHNANISVNLGPKGQVQTLHLVHYAGVKAEDVQPAIDVRVAELIAERRVGAQSVRRRYTEKAALVWYIKPDGAAALAWKLLVAPANSVALFEVLVDSRLAGVLTFRDTNMHAPTTGSGLAFTPNPVQTQGNAVLLRNDNPGNDQTSLALDAQRQVVTLLELNGTGFLDGKYVNLSITAPMNATISQVHAFNGLSIYNYDRSDPRFEEVCIYYTIDSVQRYFQALGFSDANVPANGLREQVTFACAHSMEGFSFGLNALFNDALDEMHFGNGNMGHPTGDTVDLAEDGDVIAHEYGHAVLFSANPFLNQLGCTSGVKGGNEVDAIHEGFGDYLAYAFWAESGNAGYMANPTYRASNGEWAFVAYSGNPPYGAREVNASQTYATFGVPLVECHDDGEIWAAALWDLRLRFEAKYGKPLGGQMADKLVYESLRTYPATCTFLLAALQIYQADINLNGGINAGLIIAAFNGRGISQTGNFPNPPDFPDLVVGNNGQSSLGYSNQIGSFGASVVINAVATPTMALQMGDVNSDSRADLIVGNYGQISYLYINNGTGGFPIALRQTITADTLNTRAMALGDVDGDGDLDLVAGNFGQVNKLYLNNGTPTPFSGATGTDITTDVANTTGIALNDVDGDGDLDVIVSNEGSVPKVYLNSGTGTFSAGSAITGALADTSQAMLVADVTGAGRRVLLANQSPGQFEVQLVATTGRNAALEFFLGDPSAPKVTTSAMNWTINQWYNVVVRRVGNTVSVWRDGLMLGENTTVVSGNAASPANQRISLGRRTPFPAYSYNGMMDDVRLYGRALTDPEVEELFVTEWAQPMATVFDQTTSLRGHYPIQSTDPAFSVIETMLIGPDGVPNAGASRVSGRYGAADVAGAYELVGGVGGYINLGTNTSFGTGAFTVSVWISNASAPNVNADIIGTRVTGAGNEWWLALNNLGRVTFRAGGSSIQSNTGAVTINDTAWTHLVYSREANGTATLYVDKVPVATNTGMGANLNAVNELWVGRPGGALTDYYRGRVDGIRLYQGRALQGWEISGLFDMEKATSVGTASITVNFAPDAVDTGDSLRMRLYSNSAATETAFYTVDLNATGKSYTYAFNSAAAGNAWQDLQGQFQFTPQGGRAIIDTVVITVNGASFTYTGTVTPVRITGGDKLAKNVQMNRDSTFAMVSKLNLGGIYTFAHELGHIIGCHHGIGDGLGSGTGLRPDDSSILFNPYGSETTAGGFTTGVGNFVRDEFLAMGNHFTAWGTPSAQGGTQWGKYCTLMAYPTIYSPTTNNSTTVYQRIPRFSSPYVYWKGKPTGDSHGFSLPPPYGLYSRPLYFDNVRVHQVVGPILSYYRDDNGSGRLPSEAQTPMRMPQGIPDQDTNFGTGGVEQVAQAGTGTGTGASGSTAQSGAKKKTGLGAGTSGGGGATTQPTNPTTGTTGTPPVTTPGSGGLGGTTGKPTNPPTTNPNPPQPGGLPGNPAVQPGVVPSGPGVPNDSKANSLAIQLKRQADQTWAGTADGHNRGATADAGENALAQTDDRRTVFHGRSVWWHAVVPQDGDYAVQGATAGSTFDTTLSMVVPENGVALANDNDPNQTGPASRVQSAGMTLKAGQVIYFAVDGVNGAQGRVQLNVRLTPLNTRRTGN